VLTCRDALVAAGAQVETVAAQDDAGIDAALAGLPEARLIVAAAADGQVRAVVRRLVRRDAQSQRTRPADLPADRTVPDLPPLGVLPLGPAGDGLVARLGLPATPAAVAAAVLAGHTRRLDLLRNDGGSVTLHGALLGVEDAPFAARVEVDDTVLADGSEPLVAALVANADGYATLDGLPLAVEPDPADGVLDVAVALPVLTRWRRLRVEVRRARGRAVVVVPGAEVRFTDDGVAGTLAHKRTWWMERAAWGVYAPVNRVRG
jgi:Diacylglycerol kinase catalytic domain